MKPLLLLLLLLSSSWILSSCADKKNEAIAPAQNLVHHIPAKNLKEANSIAKEAKLVCENSEECPENVGMLVASTENSVLECTSFLVGSDLVLTNAHCLPAAVKFEPELCKDRIKFIFPAGESGEEETIACKSFIGASDRPNSVSPDMALFQLEKNSSKSAFSLNQNGLKNGQKLTFYGITPTQKNSPKGILQKQDCEAVANSFRFPIYKKETDSVFSIGGCESKPGNSGSPLIDQDGKVAAIMQAFLPLQENFRKRLAAYENFNEEPGKISIATSMRCYERSMTNIDNNCPAIDTSLVKAPGLEDVLKNNNLESVLEKESQEKLKQIIATLDPTFQWTRRALTNNRLERAETLSPKCFQYPIQIDSSKITSKIPTLETKMSFNKFYQMSAKLSLSPEIAVYHTFDKNELIQKNSSLVKEIRDSEETDLGELPFCS
ncbi:MAG: serine protease [Oligoflexia bacterium]|nr:serine protease [Oligoflexia bacterium]